MTTLILSAAHFVPQLVNAQIDTSDRWLVRDFYNYVFSFGTDATMDWTGIYDGQNTNAGTVSADWLEATRMRVNFYRAMAGVDPRITFDSTKNAASQASALIISANHTLTHTPPTNFSFWTQEGYDAASHGNISYNSTGLGAIDGYMIDFGGSNTSVGHRQWINYPQSDIMGSGDVPGDGVTYAAANTLWVQPLDVFATRPATRDNFVAWPPPGYVPSDLVWSRWSLAYPNADFGQATVEMIGPSGSIPLVIEHRTTGVFVNYAPESNIVWVPNGMDTDKRVNWPTPSVDEAVQVTVSNVTRNGNPIGPFSYTVNIFDPYDPGNNEFQNSITDPGDISTLVPTNFTVASRTWSEGLQGRSFRTEAFSQVLDAESGIAPFIANTSDSYSPITGGRPGNSTNVYHLVHPTRSPQTLTISEAFLVGSSSPQVSFNSSLGFATEFQHGSVDINLGDGYNWQSIWQTNGPKGYVTSFQPVTLDLSQWSGNTIRLRFRYHYTGSNNDGYYYQTEADVGWAFDNITLTGLTRVIDVQEFPVETDQPHITTTFTEARSVFIQARDIAFTQLDSNGFGLDWGPALSVTPSADSFSLSGASPGVWTNHQAVGWIHGVDTDWIYSFAMGWIGVNQGTWLYTGIGWVKYVSGNLDTGLWLYSPDEGFIYLHSSHPGRFLRSPFSGEPATWGSFQP